MAHRRGDTQKDMFYIGAYLGYVADNKLRSLSGKTRTTNVSIANFLTNAHNLGAPNGNGGSGYDMWGWYQLIFLQCMYVLKYKNLNSQAIIGMGYYKVTQNTGGTVTWGMDKKNGTASGSNEHMKLFGIEDFWGQCMQRIMGFYYTGRILTATENFNASATGYIDRGASGSQAVWGGSWITKVMGTTHGGFLMIYTGTGSSSTYYCDYCRQLENFTIIVGTGDGDVNGGIFSAFLTEGTGEYSWITTRLMYL